MKQRMYVVQQLREIRITVDADEEIEDGEDALQVAIRLACEASPDPRAWDCIDLVAYEA